MKRIDRYIFKEHLTPFALSLFVLLFILLANFLLRTIDKFLGKDLSINLLFEYLFYNMAWILALAAPMAVLIATLTAFGRFSADNEITAMRTCGISTLKLLRAPIIFGSIIAIMMIYFNNVILPEMNHKAKSLSYNISKKRPDLDFEEGRITEAIPNYSIYIGERKKEEEINRFYDIYIFNSKSDGSKRTITADNGTVESIYNGVILHLRDGELHEMMNEGDDYTKINFDEYDIMVPIDNLVLKRKELKSRNDRDMTPSMMRKRIENIKVQIDQREREIEKNYKRNFKNLVHVDDEKIKRFKSFISGKDSRFLSDVKRNVKNLSRGINSDSKQIVRYNNNINKYLVELNKKYSIPVASIVFILIGAPLGVMARRGNFALSTTIGLGFFILYWAFLIAGENFADRGVMSPFLSMWLPNIVLGSLGVYLIYKNSKDTSRMKFEIFNLIFNRKKRSDGDKRI
tara:strand:+ start:119 stop:1495 length:1377 start_codon:yes stop_codon:yes gene_type:complete